MTTKNQLQAVFFSRQSLREIRSTRAWIPKWIQWPNRDWRPHKSSGDLIHIEFDTQPLLLKESMEYHSDMLAGTSDRVIDVLIDTTRIAGRGKSEHIVPADHGPAVAHLDPPVPLQLGTNERGGNHIAGETALATGLQTPTPPDRFASRRPRHHRQASGLTERRRLEPQPEVTEITIGVLAPPAYGHRGVDRLRSDPATVVDNVKRGQAFVDLNETDKDPRRARVDRVVDQVSEGCRQRVVTTEAVHRPRIGRQFDTALGRYGPAPLDHESPLLPSVRRPAGLWAPLYPIYPTMVYLLPGVTKTL
ncbi:hypothetical protein LX83_006036 [Goodfellowiella coeruleoviolacea]|uniref:Uncharacterized protein n=1 Tax=Goodfellowiella coeruleoviolacea TaxID=334858 RepID=A0AAE3GKI9_9PSEU|nr:hypothetical protein [Goodfellowiella coeruleoviolacea]